MNKPKRPYFPMFVDLSAKHIIIIGAGTIAKRRIRSLLDFTDHLTVIAPEVNKELMDLAHTGTITLIKDRYRPDHLLDADIVIAATNEHQTNKAIYDYCKEQGILINVCSDKTLCDFYFPGLVRRENVVIGVTASGTNHKEAKHMIQKIDEML